MTTPLRPLSWCLFTVIVMCAPSRALAQGPVPVGGEASSSQPGRTTDDTTAEHDRYCASHWFDVGRCRERGWAGPEIMFGAELGVSSMNESGPFGFENGVGGVTNAGPSWGVRVGVEFLSWFALEGRYVGSSNAAQSSVSPAGSVAFLTSGAEAFARFTAPLPFVHPYIFGGVGYYDVALTGSSSATAGAMLHSSSQSGIPMGFGLDVPITWHLSLGAEATYHLLLGENFSNVTKNGIDGGDLSTFNAVIRVRL